MIFITIVKAVKYIYYIVMEDKNLDAHKSKIDSGLWLKMKISAMQQGKKIHEWLTEAIEMKLRSENCNESKNY